MHPSGDKQTVIFVGGAPRSGTTVAHQLICTSKKTNVYHPEISFILPLIHSYLDGETSWDHHTHAYFAQPEHFQLHSRKHIEFSLAHVSRVLGNPEILSVKNPRMTPFFSTLYTLMPDRAKFVTVVRHPHSVVRSLQAVLCKKGQEFGVKQAREAALDYMKTYAHIDDPALESALFVFRYEDLLNNDVLDDLRSFTGMPDIDPDKVGSELQTSTDDGDPWFSPKYHAKIDTSNRLGDLDPKFRAAVDEICRPMMERFDYQYRPSPRAPKPKKWPFASLRPKSL